MLAEALGNIKERASQEDRDEVWRTWWVTESMEAFSRKAEKEKLAELEVMLADATFSGDVTGECFV